MMYQWLSFILSLINACLGGANNQDMLLSVILWYIQTSYLLNLNQWSMGFFTLLAMCMKKKHSTCLSIFYYIKEQAFSVLIFFGRPLLYLEHQSKQKNGYVSGQFLDRLSIVLFLHAFTVVQHQTSLISSTSTSNRNHLVPIPTTPELLLHGGRQILWQMLSNISWVVELKSYSF